ncbi:hypothetical protein D3C87_657990 [compost metagenome]
MTEETKDPAPESDDIPVDKLTKVYIKIRDAKADRKAKWEAEEKELQSQLDEIENRLLEVCRRMGVDSLRTEFGTVMRGVSTRYWTQDWQSMHEFIKENDALYLLEKRISQKAMAEFLEDNPDKHPPGMSSNSEYKITVRRKS